MAPARRAELAPREDIFDLMSRPFKTVAALCLQSELDLLYSLQKARRRLPLMVRWTADRLICAHPLYDFSLVVWTCTLVALYFMTWGMMWALVGHVLLSFLLAMFVGGPVPAALDSRIKARGRASPSGFPCIELHLATVCLVICGQVFPHPAAILLGVLTWLLLLSLRLYGVTHFPHQLVLSTALGLLSVPAFEAVAGYMLPRGLPKQLHVIGMCLVGAMMLCYVAYKAENNDSPVFRVPREEFTRVLGDIMAGDDAAVQQRIAAIESDEKKEEEERYGSGTGSGSGKGRVQGSRRRVKGQAAEAETAAEAEAAWRAGGSVGGSTEKGSAAGSSRGPPAGPQPRTGSAAVRPPAGPVLLSTGTGRLPPAGPAGYAYGYEPSMVIPPVPDPLGQYPDEEEYEDEEIGGRDKAPVENDGDAMTTGTGGSNPTSLSYPSTSASSAAGVRPARDSAYYLMRGMERRAHKQALQGAQQSLLGRVSGEGGAQIGNQQYSQGGTHTPSKLFELPAPASLTAQQRPPKRLPQDAASKEDRQRSSKPAHDPTTAAYWGYGDEEYDY